MENDLKFPVRITLVANAGILFSYRGTTLLADSVYGDEGHSFSSPSPDMWNAMLSGEHPFEKIDYLLFTHAHLDHFSPAKTEEFLRRRSVKGVFFPDVAGPKMGEFRAVLKEIGIPAVPFSKWTDQATFQIEPEISVHAFSTFHLDKKYRDVPHFCCILTFGEEKILLTSDVDYTSETFENLKSVHFKAVFVNPLFFSALRCKRFFKGQLNTESYYIYHVPFASDDSFQMRARLNRDLNLWPKTNPVAFALDEPLQTAEF